VNDILLASRDKNLLHKIKEFLSSNFDTKNLGDAYYVLGIEIHRDRSKGALGLSQKFLKDIICTNVQAQLLQLLRAISLGNFKVPEIN
jgi:hypothetical protein